MFYESNILFIYLFSNFTYFKLKINKLVTIKYYILYNYIIYK